MRPEENDCISGDEFSVESIQRLENLYGDVYGMTDEQVTNARQGWLVHKMFKNCYGGKHIINYDPNYFYYGFIDDYLITRRKSDKNEDYYYIKLNCSLYIDGFGFYVFSYEIPATCTHKCKFTQLMCDLGYNLSHLNKISLDELKGKPIRACLTTKNNFTIFLFISFTNLY